MCMKIALSIITICLGLFLTKTSLAQTEDYFSGYKERIKLLIENKDYDSIIVFSFYQFLDPPPPLPSTPPTVESLNNRSHYNDAFLVCFKNDSCFALCMADYGAGIGISNRILIKEKPTTDKLRQSWAKAQKEYFLPFIYRHTENNKARYDTLNFLHPAQGNLTFRRRGYYETKDFLPLVTAKTRS